MIQDNALTYEELYCLHEITTLIISESNIDKILKNILTLLSDKTGLKRGIISIYYKELSEIHHDSFGFENPEDEIVFAPGEGITGEVVKSGLPIAIPRLDQSPIFLDKTGIRKRLRREELAFICVPIKYKGETIGALSVDRELSENDKSDLTHEIFYLTKISELLSDIVKRKLLIKENESLKAMVNISGSSGTIIGNSKPMKDLAHQITLIANSNVSVLIMGETGTGKELVAKQIHDLSPRKNKTFITINCGAIPEGLIESELFGHTKGSFTGAVSDRIGKFQAADGGTIFLDEIGELPLMLQVKLLRVLQEKEITRVGDNNNIKIDVRVIAATNRNLEEEILNGKFRSDLYYRLNVFQLYLPPLRERGADIILLCDYFIKKYASQIGKVVSRIDTSAIDMLTAYHWPGNVRELENCVERSCILAQDGVIQAHHLPPSLQMKMVENRGKKRGKFEALVRAYEIELITDALKDADGNQTYAAEILGTTKRVIQYKIAQYGIEYKRFSKQRAPSL